MNIVLPPTPISPYLDLPSTGQPDVGDAEQASHDVNLDDDLFPDTSVPISRSTNPAMVPLPPSPNLEPSIPTRRPAGWITSLPPSREVSVARRPSSHGPSTPSQPARMSGGKRRVSARMPSGPSPLRIGGRTVSGAMQYAIQRDAEVSRAGQLEDAGHGTTDESSCHESLDVHLPGLANRTQFQNDDDESPGSEATSTSDSDDSMDELSREQIANSVVGLTDQAQDEVWMEYVRGQLGTLFPDFFNEAMVDSTGPTSGPASRRADGEADEARAGWAMMVDGAHRRPVSTTTSGNGGGRGQDVPNVREEIHGLKDEIERLRGVVGSLAEVLHRENRRRLDHTAEEADDTPAVVVTSSVGDDDHLPETDMETGANGPPLPEAFVRTAHLSIEIIRALSHGLRRSADGQRAVTVPDDEIFSEVNLLDIQSRLVDLLT